MKDLYPHALNDFHVLLGRHIERLKVGWHIDRVGYISGFGRFGGKPGNGAIAMRHICWLADRNRLDELALGADNDRLCQYYEQFGFVRTDEGRRMGRHMVRPFYDRTIPRHYIKEAHKWLMPPHAYQLARDRHYGREYA